jgi:hypothetical protein
LRALTACRPERKYALREAMKALKGKKLDNAQNIEK